MSTTNAKINTLTSRITQPSSSSRPRRHDDDHSDLDDEALFAQLEEEIENDSNVALREQGIQRLKAEMERLQQMKSSGHGRYEEITDEREVIRITANEKRCIIHFFHTDFTRCQIMDKHIAALAPKYFGTRFVRVFVENVPWLVEKLGVKVLPCVICFADGVTKDRQVSSLSRAAHVLTSSRLIGFEDLGNDDKFETATLEWRLLNSGILVKEQQGANIVYGATPTVRQQIRGRQDDDSDFDIDD
ncbi:thioredoxin-like protein [Fomitopsis serialis]|uniref:thioredoxin-like protein n=1 Tax=Fomitopsis serialis TaxID=139415 RepID=UPI002008C2DA|nr:thioredoxin-like protein [Neoantrodia serialis]KAH9938223.1 thioredoxin-like protein [Neoantrodia serialis]